MTPPSGDEVTSVTTDETVETEVAVDSGLADPTHETISAPVPLLRSATDRTYEILAEIGNHQSLRLPSNPRTIFAVKTGILDAAVDNSDLAFSVKALLDQMDVVKRIDQGGCDLLIVMDSISKNVVLSSNLYGDDQIDKYKESFYFEDDQQLFEMLETFIRRYYCFNILGSMNLLRPMNDGFAAEVTLNGESDGMVKVGGSIDICLNSNRDAYSMLLSVNSEAIYMLFPLIREEHVPLVFKKPYCTAPMEVSPPTGSEMIAAILYLDKALLPVDRYLAAEDQVIIEPASWSYSPHSSNSAVDYCESLFISLNAAPSDQYSVISRFIKTYN